MIIPQTNVQIQDWNGIGYIVKDPLTGSGTYMITGGLAGGDSTSQADGMEIVEIFTDAFGWLKNKVDLFFRGNIAEAAELNIGDYISGIATTIAGYPRETVSYEDIGQCVGLVRMAYSAAGICLDRYSGCNGNAGGLVEMLGISGSNGVSYFYNLAEALDIPTELGGSVRQDRPRKPPERSSGISRGGTLTD